MSAILKLVPDVAVPCVLDIDVGVESVSLNTAIDTLAELTRIKKQIEAEEKALRVAVCDSMLKAGLESHTTPSGHAATPYESTATSWDGKYLAEVLSPEALQRAKRLTPYIAVRIS